MSELACVFGQFGIETHLVLSCTTQKRADKASILPSSASFLPSKACSLSCPLSLPPYYAAHIFMLLSAGSCAVPALTVAATF
eukprot:1156295-Pelagomonas_calceolata.AAC.11